MSHALVAAALTSSIARSEAQRRVLDVKIEALQPTRERHVLQNVRHEVTLAIDHLKVAVAELLGEV